MKAIASIISLIGLVSVPVSAAAKAESHCQKPEQIIFSCSLGKKIVSVCASHDFSSSNGYLQYRFGEKDALELAFPPLIASIQSSPYIQARTLIFAGGGGAYLRFIKEQYHYVVYTAIGKGWGAKDGVAVEKNSQLITHLECQDIPVSKLNEEFFSRAGLSVDQDEFQIPGLD